ncbi:MAG: DUF4357 domain-containing protein [Candidatus Dojkabacteria bacterium]|nr:DUF4357 domain-containing protein [Candidatus Dojkabacteria bacterium]MDQ7020768.1 DUF4357 domain-containing protein [Candidatus Dojkabacteria bacterium]
MEEFFEQMKIVSSSLGYTFLEKQPQNAELLYCIGKNTNARGIYSDEGLTVLEGSVINKIPSESFIKNWNRKREFEIRGSISEHGKDSYILTKNLLFSSPSAASGACLARSSNGWTDWKNKEGKTLDELKRK